MGITSRFFLLGTCFCIFSVVAEFGTRCGELSDSNVGINACLMCTRTSHCVYSENSGKGSCISFDQVPRITRSRSVKLFWSQQQCSRSLSNPRVPVKGRAAAFPLNVASVAPLLMHKPLLPQTPPKLSEPSPFKNVTAPTCTTRENVTLLRNGLIDPRYRWTNFNVHPDTTYNAQELQVINDGMYNLMQVIPCVNFGIWPPESKPTEHFVYIIKGTANGCNSHVGRLGGRQDMNLESPACMDIGTVMHELIHALGFQHEHCRPDRDDYVDIFLQNVIPGYEYAFDKYPTSQVTTFGVPYNVKSIMHYHSDAFSSNGQPTILAKNGEQIGSTGNLEATDIQKLKALYGCQI